MSVPAVCRLALVGIALSLAAAAPARTVEPTTYLIVLEGSDTPDGFAVGGDNLLNLPAALSAIAGAGGVVTADLGEKIGVVIATSVNPLFADQMRQSALVHEVGIDLLYHALRDPIDDAGFGPTFDSFVPEPGMDSFEHFQWGMRMIGADAARAIHMGDPAVTVAVLDSGVDVTHPDFYVGTQTNIDVARARSFVPEVPNPLVEGWPHGTSVAGIIAARKNGIGTVGVAPNVTIVPITVVDASFSIRPSSAVQGISYAGDIRADVINMSFFIDAEDPVENWIALVESRIGATSEAQFKCASDPQALAIRESVARAIRYARKRGALPVAAAGNTQNDLSADDDCDMIPQETPGVVTVSGLDVYGELVSYSEYGSGVIDVAAPTGYAGTAENPEGGGYVCAGTFAPHKGATYLCGDGTSFAAPHASGVAALIVSQFGRVGPDGDMRMNPNAVEDLLLDSAIDVGLAGDDLCYGIGRVDALRAVTRDTRLAYEETGCLRNPSATAVANSCPGPQVVDPIDDAGPGGLTVLTTRDHLDIASAAFTADDGGALRITLTIENLALPPPSPDYPGAEWAVYFDYAGVRYIVAANGFGSPDTLTYQAGRFTGGSDEGGSQNLAWIDAPTPVQGSFNPGPNGTIVFTVPLSAVGNPPHGAQLTNLTAGTYLATPVSRSPRSDDASGVDYTVGEVCVPPAP